MTKKPLTTNDIVDQKLNHIKYFAEDANEALLVGIARDACYTANNSLQFKRKQLADILAEYDRHMAEKDTRAAERSEAFAGRLALELEILEERLEIEKSVFFIITGGEEWKPSVRREPARKKVDMSALRKKLAS